MSATSIAGAEGAWGLVAPTETVAPDVLPLAEVVAMLRAPKSHGVKDGAEALSSGGEAIIHPARDFGVHGALEDRLSL